MNEYTFLVTLSAPTEEQAKRVITERLEHDEDYGFDYLIIGGSGPYSQILYIYTADDAQAALRRPLVAGEADEIQKSLEHGLANEATSIIGFMPDGPSSDHRANDIEEGQVIREYGMDEWIIVDERGDHGDTVLIAGHNIDGDEIDTTFDIDDVVELLLTED